MINDQQLLRYSRQIMLPELDVAGQERLLRAKVLIVGLGGLGCPVALYLAAAGVGELLLADGEQVELSNLQRQIAHTQSRIGSTKVESAMASVAALNPDCKLRGIPRHLEQEELTSLAKGADLVVDASDNMVTRLAVNRACIEAGVALVSGAAIRSEGQIAVFHSAGGSACYRCLYPVAQGDENLSCAESGVLAPVVGVIGSLQALEAVKLLAGFGEPLLGSLLLVDGWSMQVRRLKLKRREDCPDCGAIGP